MSNAIQTIHNEANHLIINCLNCIQQGRNATYEPGLSDVLSSRLPLGLSHFLFLLFFSCGNGRVHFVLSSRINLFFGHGKTGAQWSSRPTPPFCHPVSFNKQRPQPNYLHVQIQRVQNRVQEIIERCFDCSAADWRQKESPNWSVTSGRFHMHSTESSAFVPNCFSWECEILKTEANLP